MTRKVLFLCTGNSCRSQMAEAIVNHRLPGEWQAFSAGAKPAGYVHPLAVKALDELGIEHRGFSKNADVFREENFDLVITMCSEADEMCPLWIKPGTVKGIGFPDPAAKIGSEEEIMDEFRSVRDQISQEILGYLGSI